MNDPRSIRPATETQLSLGLLRFWRPLTLCSLPSLPPFPLLLLLRSPKPLHILPPKLHTPIPTSECPKCPLTTLIPEPKSHSISVPSPTFPVAPCLHIPHPDTPAANHFGMLIASCVFVVDVLLAPFPFVHFCCWRGKNVILACLLFSTSAPTPLLPSTNNKKSTSTNKSTNLLILYEFSQKMKEGKKEKLTKDSVRTRN